MVSHDAIVMEECPSQQSPSNAQAALCALTPGAVTVGFCETGAHLLQAGTQWFHIKRLQRSGVPVPQHLTPASFLDELEEVRNEQSQHQKTDSVVGPGHGSRFRGKTCATSGFKSRPTLVIIKQCPASWPRKISPQWIIRRDGSKFSSRKPGSSSLRTKVLLTD